MEKQFVETMDVDLNVSNGMGAIVISSSKKYTRFFRSATSTRTRRTISLKLLAG